MIYHDSNSARLVGRDNVHTCARAITQYSHRQILKPVAVPSVWASWLTQLHGHRIRYPQIDYKDEGSSQRTTRFTFRIVVFRMLCAVAAQGVPLAMRGVAEHSVFCKRHPVPQNQDDARRGW
jgi:hypothetical protein